MSPATIRVFVADDQALVRSGFRMLIDSEDDLEVVGEAPNGAEAVDALTIWAHQGPPQARVDHLHFQDAPYTATPNDDDSSPDPLFTWRPTA